MVALYGSGMHGFVLDEVELGYRAAIALDDEACGYGPLFDALFLEDVASGRIVP